MAQTSLATCFWTVRDNKELVEKTFNDTFSYDSDWLTDIELTPVKDIYFADAGSAIYKNGSRSQMWMLI